jgi:hypothetical protein
MPNPDPSRPVRTEGSAAQVDSPGNTDPPSARPLDVALSSHLVDSLFLQTQAREPPTVGL